MNTFNNEFSRIANIIFDFGGLFIDVDYTLTAKTFSEKFDIPFENLYSQQQQSDIFDKFETGKVSPADFRTYVKNILNKKHLNTKAEQNLDKEIDRCWNAMVLEYYPETFSLLEKINKHYRTFLLSNANAIHYDFFIPKLPAKLNMEGVYFSHILGLRKPDKESYEYIINKHNLKKEDTLFIDDTIQNIEGAKNVGLKTFFLDRKKGMKLTDFFDDDGVLKIKI
ncbi:hydrolase [Bacteroidia bacterium]|nr:hydrolase [Bacteroidia bacterium]